MYGLGCSVVFRFLKFLSDDRQAAEREVSLDNESQEEHDEDGVDRQRYKQWQLFTGKHYRNEDYRSHYRVACHITQRIVNLVVMLTYEIGQEHRRGVCGKACPCTCHIAEMGTNSALMMTSTTTPMPEK